MRLVERSETTEASVGGARRIVILGCAGAGKTVLAHRIGQRAGMPVIWLDDMWKNLPAPKQPATFRSLMMKAHATESWVSDGNFWQDSFDIRLPRAELIIWLEIPKILCAWRACRRVFRTGEAHRIRGVPNVLEYIWNFDRRDRPKMEAERIRYGAQVPVIRVCSIEEIPGLLKSLKSGNAPQAQTET